MKLITSLIACVTSLLAASCTLLPGNVSDMSVEELAARVPAYDDSTPVNSWVLRDIKTIGELRAALAQGMDPNGSDGESWYLSGGSNFGAAERFSAEELMTQRLAFLEVMLKAGGDPQKVRCFGTGEERAVTYALLIRHGLRADEPFTLAPRCAAAGDYREEEYPHAKLWLLPPGIVEWLMANGAPINETFDGKTLLMDMYASLWKAVLLETLPALQVQYAEQGAAMETAAAWEQALRMTEYLISRGVDLGVKDEHGYCAIDYIPLLGERVPGEGGWTYSDELFERAARLERLLLVHGSPKRQAPGNFGESEALIGCCMMTVSYAHGEEEAMQEASRRRTAAEHEAREARLAPLRAARRAARVAQKEPARENNGEPGTPEAQ